LRQERAQARTDRRTRSCRGSTATCWYATAGSRSGRPWSSTSARARVAVDLVKARSVMRQGGENRLAAPGSLL